jgi:hypothetical protein
MKGFRSHHHPPSLDFSWRNIRNPSQQRTKTRILNTLIEIAFAGMVAAATTRQVIHEAITAARRLVGRVGPRTHVTADDAAPHSVPSIRHFPDFAAIRRIRRRGENAKIHDENLRAAEAYVDGLVESPGRKDYCRRGVGDEVAHLPGAPVNSGYLETGQARRPGALGEGAGLGDEDITLVAEIVGARKIEHIGRGVQLYFREGRLDRQCCPKFV